MALVEQSCLVSDLEIEGFVCFTIACVDLLDVCDLGDEGGDIVGGLEVAGVAHLGVACAVVDDEDFVLHSTKILLWVGYHSYHE